MIKKITRKEFLKRSSVGVVGISLIGKTSNLLSKNNLTKKAPVPQTRILGRSGIRVTTVGFGASRTLEPSLLKNALDTGINFIDTGRPYANGQNEVMVGSVIKDMRKDLVIQSKLQVRLKEKGEELKASKVLNKIKNIMSASLNASLEALQTDYIDIMLIHGADSIDVINNVAVMEFFANAKKDGKILACGFSSHENQLELLKASNENYFYDVIMVPYNYKGSYIHSNSGHSSEWDQKGVEMELEKAANNNIGIIAMKTCSAGPYSADKNKNPTYKEGLEWILNHKFIHSTAVAMANTQEIQENIQIMF